jgi:hypothetical protein
VRCEEKWRLGGIIIQRDIIYENQTVERQRRERENEEFSVTLWLEVHAIETEIFGE